MCGIIAIFDYAAGGPPVDPEEILRGREVMRSRGPDGAGLWLSPDGRVGLGHRRLALLDLTENGAQPMANEDGSLRVVFNGEIYNFRELRHRLERRGFAFRSNSDTEVLLHLYAERGERMTEELRGMYAFVIWDERQQRIFAARDPFGMKPLYYADDGHTIRLASQVKALLAGGAQPGPCDFAGAVGFLLLGSVPEPFTLHQGIRALPAGGSLSIQSGSPPRVEVSDEVERLFGTTGSMSIGRGEGDAGAVRDRLRSVLAESVRIHLEADVPVGVFLSAGLDSSLIAGFAAQAGVSTLRAVTLGFEEYVGTEYDETGFAAESARHYGIQHETRWISRHEFEDELSRIVGAMDQPTIDGVNTYFVAKVAREAGLKAALSGLGGDEFFGGYPSFRHVPQMARPFWGSMRWLGGPMRRLSAPIFSRFTSPKYAGLLEYGGTYSGAYLLRRALFMPWEIEGILGHEAAREGWQRLDLINRFERTMQAAESDHLKVAALETSWYMRNQLLRDSDWAGMAHSVEIRVPFVDREVLKTVVSAAAAGLLRPQKGDLPALAPKGLPDAIVARRKSGFAVPINEWLAHRTNGTSGRGARSWALLLADEFGISTRHGELKSHYAAQC